LSHARRRIRVQRAASTFEERTSTRCGAIAGATVKRATSSRTAFRTYRWLTDLGATTNRNACEPTFVATICRSPLATEIERELGPPSASTIVSTEANIVAAITLTTSNRMPSRVHEAKTDPVLRRNRTASSPPSVSIADRNDSEAFSSAESDFRPRPTPSTPPEADPLVYPLKKVAMHAWSCADMKRRTRSCRFLFTRLQRFRDSPTFQRTIMAFLPPPSFGRFADVFGKTCARNQIAYPLLNTG